MNESIGSILISLGIAFDFFGCLALMRFSDVYQRLSAATKCVVPGTMLMLFGAFCIIGWTAAGFKCLLAVIFLFLTVPAASHALARAARRADILPACRDRRGKLKE